MENRIKNDRDKYISRSLLANLKNEQKQLNLPTSDETAENERYSQAVIEAGWYINFDSTKN